MPIPITSASIRVDRLSFQEISADYYVEIRENFLDEAGSSGQAGFPDFEVVSHIPGSIFLLYREKEVIGCALCYGGAGFDSRHHPAISNTHEFWFIRELNVIGSFCFIKFIAIRLQHRQKGYARLIVNAIETFYSSPSTTIIGAVVHESNYSSMRLLHLCDYQFIDHYRGSGQKDLFYRVVKIQDTIQYYRSVNSANLYKASQTLIPIQLNIASHNINGLIKRMGAKLTWASFFQLSPLLTLEFGMKKVYNGYYNTLLTSSPKVFSEGVKTLKDAMDYIEQKEVDGITSISSILIRNVGLQFIIMNKEIADVDLPSFAKPIILNLNTATAQSLSKLPAFKIGQGAGLEEERSWKTCLDKKANKKHLSQVEQDEWDYWVEQLALTQADQDRALALARQRSQKSSLNSQDQNWLNNLIRNYRTIDLYEEEEWNEWIQFHRKLSKTDLKEFEGKGIWSHVVVPMCYSGGISCLMFSFIVQDEWVSRTSLNDISQLIINACSQPMSNILIKARDHALRNLRMHSAVSTIMTRNLAHNIGSHVLSNLFSAPPLYKETTNYPLDFTPGSETIEQSELEQFNNYLRTRMDFLADISTSVPVASSTHKLNSEVIRKFKDQEIINRYISGTQLQHIELIYENQSSPGQDLPVQISNGTIGYHALFVILENIIRNCAKHDNQIADSLETLKVTIRCEGITDDRRHYKIIILDNLVRKNESPSGSENYLVDKLNQQFIYPPLFDKDLEIRSIGWGLLEMKIAAAYLRKISPISIDEKFDLPLLKAVEIPSGDGGFHLGYEIFLKKPREILIVDRNYSIIKGNNSNEWLANGIRVVNPHLLQASPGVFFSHEIAIYFGKDDRKEIERQKTFPLRWVLWEEKGTPQIIEQLIRDSPDQFILTTWEKWLKSFLHRKAYQVDPSIFIRLDRKEDDDALQNIPFEKTALFDLHGNAVLPNGGIDPEELFYYEAIRSTAPAGVLIRNLYAEPPYIQKRLSIELLEAACTEVVIIDERIQKKAASQIPDIQLSGLDFIDQLRLMKIYLPKKEEVDLLNETQQKEKLFNWIRYQLKSATIDFFVIHLGTIEKIVGTDSQAIERFILEEIKAYNERTEIVITTGRGKPRDVAGHTLFVHYSNIARFVIEERSKFHLCKILFSARTRLS